MLLRIEVDVRTREVGLDKVSNALRHVVLRQGILCSFSLYGLFISCEEHNPYKQPITRLCFSDGRQFPMALSNEA